MLDDDSDTRVAVAMSLAWMRHDRAEGVLQEGYHREQDGEVKARILCAAASLSPLADDLLQNALHSRDTRVREPAEYLAHGQR